MQISSATFLISNTDYKKGPKTNMPEYAFIGRSNVGKSSLINMITDMKGLAKTSQTPGKTQTVNHFLVNEQWYLADLPGYGYAKVPVVVKKKWHELMEKYLTRRKSLCAIILVMDVRHPLTEFDWQMVEWCQHTGLALHILLTKADKLTYGAAKNTLLQVQKELNDSNFPLTIQLFSALKKTGVDEVHQALDLLFNQVEQTEPASE